MAPKGVPGSIGPMGTNALIGGFTNTEPVHMYDACIPLRWLFTCRMPVYLLYVACIPVGWHVGQWRPIGPMSPFGPIGKFPNT